MRNASLALAGQLNVLTSGSEVGVDRVERATRLILDRGVTARDIELYTDKFFGAALEGRLPAQTREAYVHGLLQLVDALPSDAMPAVAVRTRRALTEELEQLERTIAGYELEIRELDRQIEETNARVAQKLQRGTELSSRREQLLRQIETANRQKQAVFVFAAIIGIATAGAGAPLAGALTGTATVAVGIAEAQGQIDRVRSELARVDEESSALRSLAEAFATQRQTFESNVAALRHEEAALREAAASAAGEGGSPQVNLAVELIITRTLANNLQQQIRMLRAQLKSTRALEQQLDGMIERLESEVAALEQRAERAQRELLEAILTTAIALAGRRTNLRVGPFSFSKAKLLTGGIDFLRMSLAAQVGQLINNAVVQGVLHATGSQHAMRSILSAIDLFGGPVRDDPSHLSGPQTYLLDLISRSHADIDREAEAEAVRRRTDLTDEEARREAKRLIKSLRPAAALLPIGGEVDDWRGARVLVAQAEELFRRVKEGHSEGIDLMRELASEARAKLRPDTPPHRSLGLFLSATDGRLELGYATAGLYSALAILELD